VAGRRIRRGRERRGRRDLPPTLVRVEPMTPPAPDPVRLAVLAMESLGRASLRASFTGIEVHHVIVTGDCFAHVDPIGKDRRPFPNVLRSRGVDQLRDHLLRHDDSAVQPMQDVDRPDESEIVEGELSATTTLIATMRVPRQYPSERLPR